MFKQFRKELMWGGRKLMLEVGTHPTDGFTAIDHRSSSAVVVTRPFATA